ncbi:MAG TPA: protein translocase subunit SecF [Candidatus Peribacteraceae bacterium]|nr:protein translocase subunit SecF [Candidatus Peribacteraceae bacterium]
MSFLKLARFFVPLSAVLVVISLVLLVYPGLKLSLDFTGGTMMELRLPEGKAKTDLEAALDSYAGERLGNVSLAETRARTVLLRLRNLSNEEHTALLDHIEQTGGPVTELQFTTIGPTVGASLKRRSLWALGLASLAIVGYIAFAFRQIPRHLSPWRFGVIAVATLLHDILITVGIFVILSQFTTFEVDTLFVTALLTILGYSVNDTIVIFDRIRDNLLHQDRREPFPVVAEKSLQQTLSRSLKTAVGTLIMLFSLLFLGAPNIRWFVLTLIIGIFFGTYSSIFIATPLLVYWRKADR